jgi:hypothetical protein
MRNEFTTLKKYQDNYPKCLDIYLKKNEDNDENSFIDSELNYFKEIIKPIINNEKSELELKFGEGGDITKSVHKEYISSYLKIIDFLDSKKVPQIIKPSKPNKSLLFEGKELNLSERFKIANKVLNIDKEIRKINIKELERHQLLAYILGCDITTARNLYNGTYNSKDRDLSNYFNDLGLKE